MSPRADVLCPRCFSPVPVETSGTVVCEHCGTDFVVSALQAGDYDESPLATEALGVGEHAT